MGSVPSKERQAIIARAPLAPIFGAHVQVYDAEALPCRCPPLARYVGIECVPVECERKGPGRRYRCLMCGTTWCLAADNWTAYDVAHAPPPREELSA